MILYQTVGDRGNPDEINNNSPFKCTLADAWLGDGYYFWDTSFKNAHWWGRHAHRQNGYVISKYRCDFSYDKCFDLVGNMEHIETFREYTEILKRNNLPVEVVTVPFILEHMKQITNLESNYEAIRARGERARDSMPYNSLLFSVDDPHFLNIAPHVQICLFRKNSLNLSKGEIVYPDKYITK